MRFDEKMTEPPASPLSSDAQSQAAIAPAAPQSRLPLFFQRRFLPMWTALSLGAFTDNMLKQALSVALIYALIAAPLIGNDDALPVVGALFPIAMLIFSSIAGQLADKYETAMMFRRTKFIELLLMIIARPHSHPRFVFDGRAVGVFQPRAHRRDAEIFCPR